MIYRFGAFSLDKARQELRRGDALVEAEPLALALIQHLIEHRDRLVGKDELFDVLWDGRAVSDAALSTCIKSARRAVDDSGTLQAAIKTVHGKGLRWVAQLETPGPATTQERQTDLDQPEEEWIAASRRPSLAILPFDILGGDMTAATLSEAIPHELIAAISRLRWISVIARGSSFRFRSGNGNLVEIRQKLGVRYCLTGSVEMIGRQVCISVELAETSDGQVIWAERFQSPLEEVHQIRETIVAQVIFAVEMQIPLSEAAKARLQSPENIDVWATYHLGLQSLYRFDQSDNARAIAMFEKAIALDPGFARAHAALSFAHFKTAFMHYGTNRDVAVNAARGSAERGIELDPMDPFTNFNMGRSLWLVDDLTGAQSWLGRATSLSPSFAQGLYARAWTETVSGASDTGRRLSDEARALSPLDPMLYAMLGTRAISLSQQNRDYEAAKWIERSANAPGSHYLIKAIAVALNDMAGKPGEAASWAERLLQQRQDITQAQFFRSFPFRDDTYRARMAEALRRHGIE
ncbi:winged helix-turn-helix domain-containing protein [Ruegeria sp. 2012CJ41-6]|uniref:Winged helix-turn-helix domain-containing protein n=1 Tax=Ruegeria spongiae TaxID=2942209 RepID=A0ABT0Q558_9RHOB|nr:winged helix-turn-helix domain-containing protein [Ruegeria spongiae]MCL6284945.1 winged helix-turn-helix domain-containing protein [Ruegeria spongiae]